MVKTPLKWWGAKDPIRHWLYDNFPPRNSYLTFVDGCLGGGSVLLGHDPAGKCEIGNDIDDKLLSFWGCLQEPSLFSEFKHRISTTPVSRLIFEQATSLLKGPRYDGDDVEIAWAIFVVTRQSFAGGQRSWHPISTNRTRRGMCEQTSAWWGAIERLDEVRERISKVALENVGVCELVRKYDKENVFIYSKLPHV